MKKYLRRINQIEEQAGITDREKEWLAWIGLDGTVDLTTISDPNPQETKQTLTAKEFEAFKQEVNHKQITTVEWA